MMVKSQHSSCWQLEQMFAESVTLRGRLLYALRRFCRTALGV